MNKFFTPSLVVLGLFFASCGKNDNNNTTSPMIPPPPVVTNPVVNPWGGATPVNLNSLRQIFSTSSLSSNVRAGDYFDKVEVSGFFNISFNFIFFGQRFGQNNAPDRYTVSAASSNTVDVTNDGSSAETIDRAYLMNSIFSEDQTDITTQVRPGCVYVDSGNANGQYTVIRAAIIDKYWSSGYGGYGQQGQLVESVVVATGLPLYVNPISVQSSINPTRYVKRYKVANAVVNIVGAGPCQ